jgi:MtaA/CmuA family methyltransferase
MQECIEKAHTLGLCVVGFCTGQTINFMVEKLGGPESALLGFIDEPDLARALIEKAVDISIEKAKALVVAGVHLVYIGDSYASASVISPAIYRTFCAPAYRRITKEIHKLGAFVYKHCCGYYDPLLHDLPSTEIDAMDGIDPTSGMSVARTKEAVGDKLTLMGGLSCLTLLQGTPEQAYAEARHCIEAGKPNGRYVLGTACATPRFTPPENYAAVRQALEDHGWY